MNATTVLIVLVLVAWIAYSTVCLFKKGRGEGSCCGGGSAPAKKVKVRDKDISNYPYSYSVGIEGMVCSNCVRNVENAFNSVDGLWAKVDLEHKEAKVLAKREMTRDDLVKILEGTAYTLTEYKKE